MSRSGAGYIRDGYRDRRGGGYASGSYRGGRGSGLYYGSGYRRGGNYGYYRPYGYGFSLYLGLPFYRYYDSYALPYAYSAPYYGYYDYAEPYYDTPSYAGYVPYYVQDYAADDSSYVAPTTSINAAVIPATGRSAEYQLQAEQAFREGRYDDSARLSNHAVIEEDRNGKLHLFASQTLFALGEYQAAAAAIHRAAALMDRSEWGFVVENYKKFYRGDDYVTQMAQLVRHIKENPDAAYARFLRGYHYKFLGYDEAARQQLAKAVELESRDRLAAELLAMAGGEAPSPDAPPLSASPTDETLPNPNSGSTSATAQDE